MVRRLPGTVFTTDSASTDAFTDIPAERRREIQAEVQQAYFDRVNAVKRQVDALSVAQREMFHRQLAETLRLISVGGTEQ
ncbi:hypothetical protein CD006_04620 [Enterobacter sp. 10-1]|uniref:hypothetical protein n=1 Tax=Raoultella sp. 10-1 TaxID=2683201 RepID=UPI000BA333FF|nr:MULTISPECIES: hypothetical protein [Enterobacteriaceae]MVT01955.1 hypothetical protein [Raoultella sp. 10-1]PAC14475.1 hypothetical protein CD006_04620 [Enterobacter sp. 10-1]